MNKAVQGSGTEAVQQKAESRSEDVRFPWAPRTDGAQAVLVTERHAVLDFKLPAFERARVDQLDVGAVGPVPTQWTADLVHYRLLYADAIMRRLPRVKVPRSYVSFLGNLQPQDAGPARRAVQPHEITLLDWTWLRVSLLSTLDRDVVMGSMAGKSLRLISKITIERSYRLGGPSLNRNQVAPAYQHARERMAEEWIALGEPIDNTTRERWIEAAKKNI